MDGQDSAGRRISLLNDHDSPPTAAAASSAAPSSSFKASRPTLSSFPSHLSLTSVTHDFARCRLPSRPPLSARSRTSSFSSSGTPQLVRSDSSDSVAMQSPSPITPNSATFDDLNPHDAGSAAHGLPLFPGSSSIYGAPPKGYPSAYPPFNPRPAPYPYAYQHPHPSGPPPMMHPEGSSPDVHHAVPDHRHMAQDPVLSAGVPPPNHATGNRRGSAQKSKKNTYPCPLAKQFNCHDYFTTSGHAARHSKKHTGKKDAICPQCHKAFTRKDNMEQHRRTHKEGGRGSTTTAAKAGLGPSDSGVKKGRPAAINTRRKTSSIPATSPSMSQPLYPPPVGHVPHPSGMPMDAHMHSGPPAMPPTYAHPSGLPAVPMPGYAPHPYPTNFLGHLPYTGEPSAQPLPTPAAPGRTSGLDTLAIAAASDAYGTMGNVLARAM